MFEWTESLLNSCVPAPRVWTRKLSSGYDLYDFVILSVWDFRVAWFLDIHLIQIYFHIVVSNESCLCVLLGLITSAAHHLHSCSEKLNKHRKSNEKSNGRRKQITPQRKVIENPHCHGFLMSRWSDFVVWNSWFINEVICDVQMIDG